MKFRNPDLLNAMYPTNLAHARYKSAIGQVSSMIKTKVRQGFLDQVRAVENVWKDELLEGKVKKMNYSQFD